MGYRIEEVILFLAEGAGSVMGREHARQKLSFVEARWSGAHYLAEVLWMMPIVNDACHSALPQI